MMQTCTISELNDKFAEIEKTVQTGRPVYLSLQGNHSIVIISAAMFEELTSGVEVKLDEADEATRATAKRLTHHEVFSSLRRKLHNGGAKVPIQRQKPKSNDLRGRKACGSICGSTA